MALLLSHVFDLVADALDGITRTMTYLLGHITGRMAYLPGNIARGMANRSTNPFISAHPVSSTPAISRTHFICTVLMSRFRCYHNGVATSRVWPGPGIS